MIETISASELECYIGNNKFVIIDVRNKEDYKKKHIYGAINIEAEDIINSKLSHDKIIILYCERGANSLMAASRLSKAGYKVKSVVGGIQAYHGRFLTRD